MELQKKNGFLNNTSRITEMQIRWKLYSENYEFWENESTIIQRIATL